MAANIFDRKDEDIQKFGEVINYETKPIFRNFEKEESMRKYAELFKQKVRNAHFS